MFSPYPGSELYEKLKKEKKINIDDNYFKNLSYQQWTLEEIRSGEAWDYVGDM